MAKNRRSQTPANVKAKKPRDRDNRPTQAERFAAARQAKRRHSTMVRVAWIATAAVLVSGVVVWRVAANRDATRTIASMTGGSCRYDTRTDRGSVNQHADSVQFKLNPPAGGTHLPTAASVGIYTAESRPPLGQVVHALEHGAITLWYDPDLPADQLSVLTDLADANSDEVLLLPQAGLGRPVAATAWHRRLVCGKVELSSLRRFIEAYGGEGPEKGARLT